MDPLPASFYGKIEKRNPVISAFDGDIKGFVSFMKRVNSLPSDHNSYSRGAKSLFEIWNKYKPLLPTTYYEEHMLDIADFLFGIKEYNLALWQGYGRYLQQFSPISIDQVRDVDHFRTCFFPEGFHTDQAKLTFRALQGCCLCVFQRERQRAGQPSQQGVQRLLSILGFVRVMMQAVLPHEGLCWLLYNGSLYIYNICRHLMSMSRTAQAIEYLLWACVCLETSVPLATGRFLAWRATLYCAVCQCYYDNQASVQAEVFSRRALGKVSELVGLEERSGLPVSTETQRAYKEATIKLAAMVFKRSVYEPRRKPRGLFRPKQKSNLKDIQNMPWPRTPSERVLMELFEGSSAQFLAVLEALGDSSRRPLHTGAPEEPEVQEVALELMSAGVSILSGIGGSTERVSDSSMPTCLNGVTSSSTLLEMAVAGENRVSVSAAVVFVKLLFRYEQWDVFCILSDALITVLSTMEGESFRRAERELTLLEALERLMSTQKIRLLNNKEEPGADKDKQLGVSMSDELIGLVWSLHTCVCGSAQDVQPERDLVLDTVLFLWSRCKAVFLRALRQYDAGRFLAKMEQREKWVWTLSMLSEVTHACGLSDTDPMVVAEMTIRLAMVLEATADSAALQAHNTDTALQTHNTASSDDGSQESTPADEQATAIFTRSRTEQLRAALEAVERGVEDVGRGWTRLLPLDGSAIGDPVFIQRFRGADTRPTGGGEGEEARTSSSLCLVPVDLVLELLSIQHRVSLKLVHTCPVEQQTGDSKRRLRPPAGLETSEAAAHKARGESALLERIRKNQVSKAVFLAQKALLAHSGDLGSSASLGSSATRRLLEEAVGLLEKAEVEERRLWSSARPPDSKDGGMEEEEDRSRVRPPPPPVLLTRTNHTMTFSPAPYVLEHQVCWYHIYGREAEGLNLKVRLGDCHLLGTGDQVPAVGGCVLRVEGLEPNQKYVFAVAAYDAQGQLVGNAIGESTRPLLASLPLPLLTAWAHLAQAAYQTGQHALAHRACSELWSHFTLPDPSQQTGGSSAHEGLAHTRLRLETLRLSSPLLLQLFLSSILMQTEMHIQQGALYCDALSDRGPLIWGQASRLAESERLLVAVDVALWLNDGSAALQAVVGIYGLLAPILFMQIPSEPVVEVLVKCVVVLQEVSGLVRQKRSASSSESLRHMIACITYYLARALRSLKDHRLAAAVMDQGKKLLHEVYETQQSPARHGEDGMEKLLKRGGALSGEEELSQQLKALEGSAMKTRRPGTFLQHDLPAWRGLPHTLDLTGHEDPILLFTVVTNSPLNDAYRCVMKFKRKACFLEFAVLLLQRAFQEDQLRQVTVWGHEIFTWLTSRDELGPRKGQERGGAGKELKKISSSFMEYKNTSSSFWSDKQKELLQKKQLKALKAQNTDREKKAVNTLWVLLGPLLCGHQRRRRLRQACSEESLWRSHLNLSLGRAHLGLLTHSLEQLHTPGLQHRYSQLPLASFSLGSSGTLVLWKNMPRHDRLPELTLPPRKNSPQPRLRARRKAKDHTHAGASVSGEESTMGEESTTGESEMDSPRAAQTNESACSEPSVTSDPTRRSASQLLDSLNKAALHLRRAMVLAHRGGHWTTLQYVCGTVWDQGCTIAVLLDRGASLDPPAPLSVDQLYAVLTPLFVTATDLLLDMMDRLQLWEEFNSEEEESGSSLHCWSALDDTALVERRWLTRLLLRTLELLHLQARWETLAHLAILFNSHTRERYTHVITPVLVHAQRRLLERVSFFRGPASPQPHLIKTQHVTGQKVSCRSYAGRQLLSDWTPPAVQTPRRASAATTEPLILSEVRRAMCLVCVPLDVDDTLRCFREALETRRHTLQTYQHSHTLLLLLLAHTQTSFQVPFSKDSGGVAGGPGSRGRVGFSVAATLAPTVDPPELSSEDFSSLGSVYGCPLPPSHVQTVLSSYCSSIKYLQANGQDSLRVQALHDLGNLHFYNGNTRLAQASWSRAVDCVLQSSGVVASWDGVSWSGASAQNTLRHAGIWGCLQAAVLTTKIAQFILTSNISQRTMCCLLSARLFKCLLQASLPHPQADLQYASYSVGEELIPGVELFSEPERAPLGSTVASLAFLCHWLYTAGHHLTALPMLALYLHFVGSVCRDPHLTIRGRILKCALQVQVLTALGQFSQAMKETAELVQGERVPQPYGAFSAIDKHMAIRKFYTNKSLLDPANIQAVEDLVNRAVASEASLLYGPWLSRRLCLSRVQLLLALCSCIHSLPEPLGHGGSSAGETLLFTVPGHVPEYQMCSSVVGVTSSASGLPRLPPSDKDSDSGGSHAGTPTKKTQDPRGFHMDPQKDRLTLGKIKSFLLREACLLLNSQQPLLPSDPEEAELAIETRLLQSDLYLQQGHASLSADMAVSALRLLQNSAVTQASPAPSHRAPSSALRQSRTRGDQGSVREEGRREPCSESGDTPQGVESRERMGPALWLRCRLAVVRSLVAHIPGTAIHPGLDSSVEAARLLKEGLEEAESWGDPDTRALLLLQGAMLNTHRGQARQDCTSLLQEAVELLSGRVCLAPPSCVTLARATLLLSGLRGPSGQELLLLTQTLLQQQLAVFGEGVSLGEGGAVILPPAPGLLNIYLPQLPLLARATMRLGHSLAVQALVDAPVPSPSPSPPPSSGPSSAGRCERAQRCERARRVLQSSLLVSQAGLSSDMQLEADALYCRGLVERSLMCLSDFPGQTVAETFLESIRVTVAHSHNLQLIRKCYLEMALVYMHQWERNTSSSEDLQNPAPPPSSKKPTGKPPGWKRVRTILNRGLTASEAYLLLHWVCVRAAAKTWEAMSRCSQLCGSTAANGDHLPLVSLDVLPDFTSNDLLNPCGGVEQGLRRRSSWSARPGSGLSSRERGQLTWVHLSRYYTHLVNLQSISTRPVHPQCVEGLVSLAADSRLSLRLAQLHSWFQAHMEAYRQQCCAPEPPTEIIRQPQIIQLCPTVRGTLGQGVELYPWSFATQPELCVQWYRPPLSSAQDHQDTVVLLFGVNRAPFSPMRATASTVIELQCGQRTLSFHRLRALHADLCVAWAGANAVSSPNSSSSSPRQRRSKTPDKHQADNAHTQMLEETRSCYAAIRHLLKPGSDNTEVPLDVSLSTLCELESCFNPVGGATVEGKALIGWLVSLLT